MSIPLVLSDKVGIKVVGTYKSAAGAAVPFDFNISCERLDTEQIDLRLKEKTDETVTDFMLEVIQDWSGVCDEAGKPVPFTAEAYRALCKIPGVAMLTFRTYLEDVGAKEKN